MKNREGFFLLDALIALLVSSVLVLGIMEFAVNASGTALKTNDKILESIELRNRRAVELFER